MHHCFPDGRCMNREESTCSIPRPHIIKVHDAFIKIPSKTLETGCSTAHVSTRFSPLYGRTSAAGNRCAIHVFQEQPKRACAKQHAAFNRARRNREAITPVIRYVIYQTLITKPYESARRQGVRTALSGPSSPVDSHNHQTV